MFPPGWTAQGQVVGSRTDRTPNIRLDADLAEYRYQFHCSCPVLLDRIHVLGQQVGTEPLGHFVPGKVLQAFRSLVGTEHQGVAFLPNVAVNGLVAQHG